MCSGVQVKTKFDYRPNQLSIFHLYFQLLRKFLMFFIFLPIWKLGDIISYVYFVSWGPLIQNDTPEDHTTHQPPFHQLRRLLCLFIHFLFSLCRTHPLPDYCRYWSDTTENKENKGHQCLDYFSSLWFHRTLTIISQ